MSKGIALAEKPLRWRDTWASVEGDRHVLKLGEPTNKILSHTLKKKRGNALLGIRRRPIVIIPEPYLHDRVVKI